jgi:hypothetical protein
MSPLGTPQTVPRVPLDEVREGFSFLLPFRLDPEQVGEHVARACAGLAPAELHLDLLRGGHGGHSGEPREEPLTGRYVSEQQKTSSSLWRPNLYPNGSTV